LSSVLHQLNNFLSSLRKIWFLWLKLNSVVHFLITNASLGFIGKLSSTLFVHKCLTGIYRCTGWSRLESLHVRLSILKDTLNEWKSRHMRTECLQVRKKIRFFLYKHINRGFSQDSSLSWEISQSSSNRFQTQTKFKEVTATKYWASWENRTWKQTTSKFDITRQKSANLHSH
jgi:hypothetical protein